ncbi:MAG: hypothetical protein PHC64_00250 [Candidatus Gastranaerophilales bacterium]|nr:hypothetical protein [Candidatus Gastranaerophilales bacterium]
MKIISKLVKIEAKLPIDNDFIETKLAAMGIKPLRWAIVSGSRCEPELACDEQAKQGELDDSDVRVLERSDKNSTGAIDNKIILTISLACENL